MIHDIQSLMYQGRVEATTLRNPDFVALARAMGAEAQRIERPDELRDVVKAALESGRPTVLDVPIDPDELPPMKPRMLALQRTVGLPEPTKSVSWKAVKAMVSMLKER